MKTKEQILSYGRESALALQTYFDWRFWYILFSLCAASYLFFLNPALIESFGEEWLYAYLKFSREIYSPQTEFYAESVLFPWLSFLLGTSKHWLFYKILCSFLTLLILPAIAYFAAKYFDSSWRSWLFVLLFVVTYRYLWRTYYLGYPDHITMICLAALALQRQPAVAFIFSVLAAVSHFSIALIGVSGLILLVLTAPGLKKSGRLAFCSHAFAGLIVGRILLEIWFYRFNYELQSRFNWALDFGLTEFIERYQENPTRFWQTPGIAFLMLYGIACFLIFFKRNFLFGLSMTLCLLLGYVALFLTVDGLRVFAAVIIAPYVFILRTIVDGLVEALESRSNG
jgi:hypothetical protein